MAQQMSLGPVGNVFYFVERFDDAVQWYSDRLGRKPIMTGGALAVFDIDGAHLTIHKIDDLNDKGPPGSPPTGPCPTSMRSWPSGRSTAP